MPAAAALAEAAPADRRNGGGGGRGLQRAARGAAARRALRRRVPVGLPRRAARRAGGAAGARSAGSASSRSIAAWARERPRRSRLPLVAAVRLGTTGYLCTAELAGARGWADLLAPPAGIRSGCSTRCREVVGAALLAGRRSPNDARRPEALAGARDRLLRQRPSVARFDSEDFVVGPLVRGEVAARQAWSGPAAAAVRAHHGLRYVLPPGGRRPVARPPARPAGAARPEARGSAVALCDPELAALTTRAEGFATPNEAARGRLDAALRRDATLFPPEAVLRGCTTFRDLGAAEARLVQLYEEVAGAWSAPSGAGRRHRVRRLDPLGLDGLPSGLASRRTGVVVALLIIEAVGLVAAVVLALLLGDPGARRRGAGAGQRPRACRAAHGTRALLLRADARADRRRRPDHVLRRDPAGGRGAGHRRPVLGPARRRTGRRAWNRAPVAGGRAAEEGAPEGGRRRAA